MAIKRERETSKTVVLDTTKNKIKEEKKSSEKKVSTQKKQKEHFLSPSGLKEEYSKITWPTAKRISRETVLIVTFLVVVSACIAFIDLGVYHLITNLSKESIKENEVITSLAGLSIAIVVIGLIFYLLRDKATKKKAV